MDQHDQPQKTEDADPRGQTGPPGGRDRSHDPKEHPDNSTAAVEDQQGPEASEEAKNQAANAAKNRAESGTP